MAGYGLGRVDIKDALIDENRTGGLDLAGESERAWSGLCEDTQAITIGDVRGEGQDTGTIDMRHEIGVR